MKKIKTYEAFLGSESKLMLPEPLQTDLITYKFKVPAKVQKYINEDIFGYYSDINDLVDELLNKYEIDASWLKDQFMYWKENVMIEPGDRPELDDYENVDEYDNDLDDWTDMDNKYERFISSTDIELLEDYAEDNFGKWENFLKEFEIDELIQDIDDDDQKEIFDELKKDFNESDLVQYFDESEELGVVDIKVEGDNFDNGRFCIEVKTSKELSDDELSIIENYIIGQCSDGWGEGFEQQPTGKDYYVSTWWSRNFGEYEIEIETPEN